MQRSCIYPQTLTYRVSPTINIPQQNGAFVTTDGRALTHRHHPKPITWITVHSGCCTLYGFGQIMTRIPPRWPHAEYFRCLQDTCRFPGVWGTSKPNCLEMVIEVFAGSEPQSEGVDVVYTVARTRGGAA